MVRVKCLSCGEAFTNNEAVEKHRASTAHQNAKDMKASLPKRKVCIPPKSNETDAKLKAPTANEAPSNGGKVVKGGNLVDEQQHPIKGSLELGASLSGTSNNVAKNGGPGGVPPAPNPAIPSTSTGKSTEVKELSSPAAETGGGGGVKRKFSPASCSDKNGKQDKKLKTGTTSDTPQVQNKRGCLPQTSAPVARAPFPSGSTWTSSSPGPALRTSSLKNAKIGSTHYSGAGATPPTLPHNIGQAQQQVPDFHRFPVLLYKGPPVVPLGNVNLPPVYKQGQLLKDVLQNKRGCIPQTSAPVSGVPFPAGPAGTSSFPGPSLRTMLKNAMMGSTHHPGAGATPPTLPHNIGQAQQQVPDFHRYPVLLYKGPPVAPLVQEPTWGRGDYYITRPPTGQSSSTTPLPKVEAAAPRPPNWDAHFDDASMSMSDYKTFLVEPNSQEFQVISEMISPFDALSVEQVVNPELYRRYEFTRAEMLRRNSEDSTLLRKLGFSEKEVEIRASQSKSFWKGPQVKSSQYSPNEVLLFYPTKSQESVERILGRGLDERESPYNAGPLGKGIYFTDCPVQACRGDLDKGCILIFSVILGDSLQIYDNRARNFVREPEKTIVQKRHPSDQFFDSASVTSTYGDSNEYAIYNRRQCCPTYLIKCKINPRPVGIELEYFHARRTRPTISWNPMPNMKMDGGWPFFADSLLEKMKTCPPEVDSDGADGDAPSRSTNSPDAASSSTPKPSSSGSDMNRVKEELT